MRARQGPDTRVILFAISTRCIRFLMRPRHVVAPPLVAPPPVAPHIMANSSRSPPRCTSSRCDLNPPHFPSLQTLPLAILYLLVAISSSRCFHLLLFSLRSPPLAILYSLRISSSRTRLVLRPPGIVSLRPTPLVHLPPLRPPLVATSSRTPLFVALSCFSLRPLLARYLI
jgi:hypothetical protein